MSDAHLRVGMPIMQPWCLSTTHINGERKPERRCIRKHSKIGPMKRFVLRVQHRLNKRQPRESADQQLFQNTARSLARSKWITVLSLAGNSNREHVASLAQRLKISQGPITDSSDCTRKTHCMTFPRRPTASERGACSDMRAVL